jgi:hypothetical protein
LDEHSSADVVKLTRREARANLGTHGAKGPSDHPPRGLEMLKLFCGFNRHGLIVERW